MFLGGVDDPGNRLVVDARLRRTAGHRHEEALSGAESPVRHRLNISDRFIGVEVQNRLMRPVDDACHVSPYMYWQLTDPIEAAWTAASVRLVVTAATPHSLESALTLLSTAPSS